jgi:Fe-S oxidoreductase
MIFDALQGWYQEFGGKALFYQKPFSNFPGATCLIDSCFPQISEAMVKVLKRGGVR